MAAVRIIRVYTYTSKKNIKYGGGGGLTRKPDRGFDRRLSNVNLLEPVQRSSGKDLVHVGLQHADDHVLVSPLYIDRL